MDTLIITEAKYCTDFNNEIASIKIIIDSQEIFVPIAPGNRHYDEIMRQVEAGTLTIADAETP